jgi:hypothetical protein
VKILFVDDMKRPVYYGLPDNTPLAITAEIAFKMWKSAHSYDELWLDHDLSEDGMNGYQLLQLLIRKGMAPKKVVCISYNVIGVNNIQWLCKGNDIEYERRLMKP